MTIETKKMLIKVGTYLSIGSFSAGILKSIVPDNVKPLDGLLTGTGAALATWIASEEISKRLENLIPDETSADDQPDPLP